MGEITITTENLEQHYKDLTANVKKDTLTDVLSLVQTEIDTCYSEWKKHTDKPTPEELTIQAAQIQTLMRTRDAVAKLL